MPSTPGYPAAQRVAPAIEDHFAKHRATAPASGQGERAAAPDAATVGDLLDVAFWASLRREEGRSPKISLAWLAPDQVRWGMTLGRAIPLDPAALVRLAPAVERPGIHLGVWREGGELRVWGATRVLPPSCFVLEVVEPGLLVVKRHRGDGAAKFANVAVLQGDQVRVVDEQGARVGEHPELLSALLAAGPAGSVWSRGGVLTQMAVSMRAHGHGGSLIVVPGGESEWLNSVVHPISYPVTPAYGRLAAMLAEPAPTGPDVAREESILRAVDGIAGLTAVDGATVITDDFEVLAFGVKLARAEGCPAVQRVLLSEPIVGDPAPVVHPAQLGGTRHLSAAQFVHDQRRAVALVASQDGRFTVFAWSAEQAVVRAHRIEALLL